MVDRVTILGAGGTGREIARVAAHHGLRVTVCDLDTESLEESMARICYALQNARERGEIDLDDERRTLGNISSGSDLHAATADACFIIEAEPDQVELKASLLEPLSHIVDDDCVVASQCASLCVNDLATCFERPERYLGIHFLRPVDRRDLVEIVRGPSTCEEAIARAQSFATALGKEPVVIRDTPGFCAPRLGLILKLEAIRMVESGVGTPAEIDRAMELGYDHRWGPLRMSDMMGLGNLLAMAENLHRELGAQYLPPVLLREMVREGRLGLESGEGFYDWRDEHNPVPLVEKA